MEHGLYSSTTPITPPTSEDGKLAWLRLIRSRKVGPATFHRLIAEHGSAEAALEALPRMARDAALADYTACSLPAAHAEMGLAQRAGLQLICFGDPSYPLELADLIDAPPLLWLRGQAALLRRPAIALVGARNASSLGQRMAARLANGLGQKDLVVVSGMARGIDTAAHEAALAAGTIAVVAGGADVVYPPENARLAAEIAERGAIVSEHPPGLQPQARHFPQRNRILSGLSLGVIVVEAAERSGSLITMRNALDQGREVLAVPGHPADPRAAGCNLMIRDGATLVRHVEDVEEALAQVLVRARERRLTGSPPLLATKAATKSGLVTRLRNHLSPRDYLSPSGHAGAEARRMAAVHKGQTGSLQTAILDKLTASPIAADQLIRDLSLPVARLEPELLILELSGQIERLPGGYIAKTS